MIISYNNVLKNKEKMLHTIKTVDNSIKGIKSIKKRFGGRINLTNNKLKDIVKVIVFRK